ncbi:NAD-dependent epimerase/dehydratase family protein [Vibrio penaeicida]|uniref:NAD-dependent epimerase/dehydratase family protein n=1 Tax=Vibrio penaeicida TaxID=104609 RepID=UPI000CE9D358|nr:NAD-dependent epimerase/dehydratase family protein [Vibrio penaeicida]
MRVLVSGANGYLGRHVVRYMESLGHSVSRYLREGQSHRDGVHSSDTSFYHSFDLVVNCARPHWSEFSPNDIALIERSTLATLDNFCKAEGVKIHTSGVWLFGHANEQELKESILNPFNIVAPDKQTIEQARGRDWKIIYCPSLIYGGEHCQLKRIIRTYQSGQVHISIPSTGFNQYAHVQDIAEFYGKLTRLGCEESDIFVAEEQGYSPLEYALMLKQCGVVREIIKCNRTEFDKQFGQDALEIEYLNLKLPIHQSFTPKHRLRDYISSELVLE